MTKIFVSGFPLDIDELGLARLIAPHGNISTIKIVRDRQTGKCKGYAFVEMETLTDAENVIIALDGLEMQDRELTVKISEDLPPVPPKPRFNKPTGNYNKPHFSPKLEQRRDDIGDEGRAKRPRRPRT